MNKLPIREKDIIYHEFLPDEWMIKESLEELKTNLNVRLLPDAGKKHTVDWAEAAVPPEKMLWIESITAEYSAAAGQKNSRNNLWNHFKKLFRRIYKKR